MDLIEQYREELENDAKIDRFNLTDIQMKLPGIKHKWVARLINHKKELNKLKDTLKQVKEKLVEDLQKEAKVILTTPTLERKADAHEVCQKLQAEIRNQELIILYLEKVENIFRTMSYDLSNVVQLIKLEET